MRVGRPRLRRLRQPRGSFTSRSVQPKPRLPLREALGAAVVAIALLALAGIVLTDAWRWIVEVLIIVALLLSLRLRAFRRR